MTTTHKRIVHCIRAPIGGAFRHVCDLVRAQSAAGHSVGLICASNTDDTFAEAKLTALMADLKLGLIRMPMRRSLSIGDISATWRVLRELHGIAPDILHGHGAKGGAYARLIGTALRARGGSVRRFYSPHGGSLHFAADSLSGKVFFALERIMERMTDGLIFVSGYEEAQYRTKIRAPKTSWQIIHNGLRQDEFESVVPAKDAADFLFIGELRHLKGPDVFLHALAVIREQTRTCPSAHIVGPGAQTEEFKELAFELGLGQAVDFHPAMPARDAFEMARCTVIPSRAESMPYIVLEACAAAVPLITTRVGGIPEIFSGRDEELVEPGDAYALAAAMREKMLHPEEARSLAVLHQNILGSSFSLEHMASAISAFYEDRPLPNKAPAARPRVCAGEPELPAHEFRTNR